MSSYPGLADWLPSSTGMAQAATHIVHATEGTVWVVTGYGLARAAQPRRPHGAHLTFPGAAACLIVPAPLGSQSSCGPLMGRNTIAGTRAGLDGASPTWYGLVPNSVDRVIVSYASGNKTTVPVVDITFLVHLRVPMQQCLTRRTLKAEVNLSTTAKTLTAYCHG